jgi:hypothetical protein
MPAPDPNIASTIAQSLDLGSLQAHSGVFLGSFLGGVLSLRFVGGLTFRQKACGVGAGCIMAHYLSPAVAHYLKVPEFTQTLGFLIGLFGLSVCSAIFDAIEKSDVWGLISSRYGKQ